MSGSIGSHFVTRDEEKECKHDCYIQRTKARVGKVAIPIFRIRQIIICRDINGGSDDG